MWCLSVRCATWRRSRLPSRRRRRATWYRHPAHEQRGADDRMVDVFPPGQQEQIRFQLEQPEAVICQQLLPRGGCPARVRHGDMIAPAIEPDPREQKHQIPPRSRLARMGMVMDQHLRDLYQKGIITYELALRAMNPDERRRCWPGEKAARCGPATVSVSLDVGSRRSMSWPWQGGCAGV